MAILEVDLGIFRDFYLLKAHFSNSIPGMVSHVGGGFDLFWGYHEKFLDTGTLLKKHLLICAGPRIENSRLFLEFV